jgi:hypothetical protein
MKFGYTMKKEKKSAIYNVAFIFTIIVFNKVCICMNPVL